MNKLNIFSFFSGSGFLDLGFELNGYSIELVNEFSSSFINAYKYSRKQMGLKVPKYGYSNIDINEYLEKRSEELLHYITDARQGDNLVGFIGGPPCPDFSVAGKQRGRYGDNGKLSLSYVQLIISQQPDFFLFENVKGLWKTAKHREFYEELKTMLSESGYYMTDRLTNAIEFGAPQNRDRILLFGVNKKLFPNCTENPLVDFPWKKYIKYSLKDLKQRLCHNKQLINSHFYRGVSELPYKLLFAVIYTHLEFRYEMSHTITSHHVHHFHQTRIPDGTLLDYMVQYRKPLFPQFFLYPKKFLPENNPHHKEFHLRPYIQNNANQ